MPAIEIMVKQIKPPPLTRHHSEPLPKIIFTDADNENTKPDSGHVHDDLREEESDDQSEFDDDVQEFKNGDVIDDVNDLGIGNDNMSLPEMTEALPEVTYGLKPRTAWMYRLMERAGIGARSARSLPWFENEKEAFQHHAEYLKRLSKLREELIHQEQSNLANALDRLKMRSYGREYVYSQPTKDKKSKQRHSAQPEVPGKRNTLITTFEKFQRMRPKKTPPLIMPLEGKSLIDSPIVDTRVERQERSNGHSSNHSESRRSERSVEENVRLNLQRLTTHPIPSIPRQGRNNHRDIVLESSSFRRRTGSDANNSSVAEERISNMQKQKQKMMKMRHEAREAEKLKLMPQSFRLDTLSDEDKMNLEKLKDYYCIYYVPPPTSSPTEEDNGLHVRLPSIGMTHSCNHSDGASTARTTRSNGFTARQVGFKIASEAPIPPSVCNCKCKMYISGSKLESSMDQIDYSIDKTSAVNNPHINRISISREPSRGTDNGWHVAKTGDKLQTPPNSQEKKRIRIDMPAIVYNNVHTPEPTPIVEYNTGLVKAFKQKELRQKELSNLMEDVKELNKLTENMSPESVS